MELMGLLKHGLVRYDAIRTQATLGNRSAYIGMSDIAKAADCLRAAVAGKIRPVSDVSHSLARELRLQRGHWFETGVADAFRASGMPFLHQLAIHISHNGVPVCAHWEKDILCQRIRVLEEELKATARHISPNGNWIKAVTQRFRLGTCEGRKTLDKDLLASALATRLPGETADNLIQTGMKTGEPYERLHIGTINQ